MFKNLLAIFAVGLVLITTAADADAARRFGGGSSFGRSAPTLRQATPPQSAPALQGQRQQQQAQRPATAANPAAAAAAKPSPWRGLLMGAAAALGITALLSALGLSPELGQFLMIALMALALFFVVRMVLGRMAAKRAGATPSAAGGAPFGAAGAQREEPSYREPARFESAQPSAASATSSSSAPAAGGSAGQMMGSTGSVSGSVMDLFSRGAAPTSASGQTEAAGPAIPEGFDKAGFEAVAKENFLKLQKAWDSGNVVEISDFTTDDFFIAVTHKLRERGSDPQTSEVINLSVNLLGILTEGDENVAVVEFDGAMKVAGEFEQVRESWVLVKKADDSTGWLLAGIEQVEDPEAAKA